MNKENNWNSEQIFIILIACIAAIFLRVYLLKLAGYSFDVGTFLSWGDKVRELGIFGIYNSTNTFMIDYPPLIPFLTNWWLTFTRSININDVYGFKLLPTLAELVLTILALVSIVKSNIKYKAPFMVFVVLQVATAFVTSGWGQVDAIMTLVIVLGYLTMEKSQYFATVIFALALLVKPQAAIAVFVYLFWLLFKKGIKQFLANLLLGAIMLGAVGLIFIANDGNFLPILWNSASRYPYISMNAFNFWWVLYGSKAFSILDSAGDIPVKVQGLTLFLAFLAPAIYYLKNKAKSQAEVFLLASYAYLVFFTFLTQMHERYLYPAVALLPFAIMANKKVPLIYYVLSLTLLVNCFVVLQSAFPQFDFSFLRGVSLLGEWTRVAGAVNVIVAIYLAIYFTLSSLGAKSR